MPYFFQRGQGFTELLGYQTCRDVLFSHNKALFDAAMTETLAIFENELGDPELIMRRAMTQLEVYSYTVHLQYQQIFLKDLTTQAEIVHALVCQACSDIIDMAQQYPEYTEKPPWKRYADKSMEAVLLFVARHAPGLLFSHPRAFLQYPAIDILYPEWKTMMETVKTVCNDPADQCDAFVSWALTITPNQACSLPESLNFFGEEKEGYVSP